MAKCQKCGKKKPWSENWIKGKEMQDGAELMGIQDRKHIGTLHTDEHICMDCTLEIWLNYPVEFTEYFHKNAEDSAKEFAKTSEGHQKIFRAAEIMNQESDRIIKSTI